MWVGIQILVPRQYVFLQQLCYTQGYIWHCIFYLCKLRIQQASGVYCLGSDVLWWLVTIVRNDFLKFWTQKSKTSLCINDYTDGTPLLYHTVPCFYLAQQYCTAPCKTIALLWSIMALTCSSFILYQALLPVEFSCLCHSNFCLNKKCT